jgi:acetyl esterase/lipase
MEREEKQPLASPIWLWSEGEYQDGIQDGFKPWLEHYPATGGQRRGAVLICPGGGYAGRAEHKAAPIARRFNAAGLHAFVVHYRVAPRRHPRPLQDVSRAMRIIRQRAGEWQVDPEHLAVLGFSAGGHLAASLGVHFNKTFARDGAALGRFSNRPDACILCYPVISSGPLGHPGSFQNLLGPAATPEEREAMSLEKQVSARTPPAFLWHTVADAGVPVENSILFALALRQHAIPFELHLYPDGAHGLGLAENDPHVATWMDLCCQWLKNRGW